MLVEHLDIVVGSVSAGAAMARQEIYRVLLFLRVQGEPVKWHRQTMPTG